MLRVAYPVPKYKTINRISEGIQQFYNEKKCPRQIIFRCFTFK